jgi:hypothetical protein
LTLSVRCLAFSFLLFGLLGHAKEQGPSGVFYKLLSEYKRFPADFFKKTDGLTQGELESIPVDNFKQTSDTVQKSRFVQYNSSYLNLLKLEKKVESELAQLAQKLSDTPLSNFQVRGDLELKNAALKNRQSQVKFAIFMASVNANLSVQDAIKTISASQKNLKESEKLAASRPKLPGVWGGSLTERLNQKNREKLNLTPVDPEFYETQLGKKLESDLGGRAEFWSYDYGTDDMYVKVGDEIGKVNVIKNQDGIRFVRTRVGAGFSEPKSADMKVDMLTAKGRFLTGDKNEETLFGTNPALNRAPVLEEKSSTVPGGTKPHNHDHGN